MSRVCFYLFSFLKFSFWNFPIPSILKFLIFSLVKSLLWFAAEIVSSSEDIFLVESSSFEINSLFWFRKDSSYLFSNCSKYIFFELHEKIDSRKLLAVVFLFFFEDQGEFLFKFFTTIFCKVFIKIQVVKWQFSNNISKLLVV